MAPRSPTLLEESRLNNAGARLRPVGLRLTRRQLLAASGATLAAGAPAVLAACGSADEDDDVTPAEEAELLNAVLEQQRGVQDALARAVGGNVPTELEEPLQQLVDLREQSTQDLERTIADLDAEPVGEAVALAGAESPAEGVARQLEVSIAASLEAIGELAPERRVPVHRAITEDAAALAAIRSVLGEEVAPDAFVMGPPSSSEEAA